MGEPAWRHFRSLGSQRQAVLGSSLEPVISSQPRVTWMPGIPEPLGCSTLGCPPLCCLAAQPCPRHLALPRCCSGRRAQTQRQTRGCRWGVGGLYFSRGKGIPLLPPQLVLPPLPLPSLPPQASSTQKIPSRQAGPWFYPGGQGLRTPSPC